MNSLTVFPYNHDAETIINYRSELKESILGFISSFREDYQRISTLDASEKDFKYTTNYKNAIDHSDVLLLCDNIQEFSIDAYCKRLEYAVMTSKKILISRILLNEMELDIKDQRITILKKEHTMEKTYRTRELLDIPVPIIAIAGEGENCDKFSLQVGLKQYFEKHGYRAASMCSNFLGSMFGMNTLPDFLFDTKRSFEEKVIDLNHYIYDWVIQDQPDLLIVGYPSGVMPINQLYHNYFAELPMILSNAAPGDIGVFCLYFLPLLNNELLKKYDDYCTSKINLPISYFCISRQQLFYDMEKRRLEYRFFDSKDLKDNFPDTKSFQYPIMGIENSSEEKQIYEMILNELCSNVIAL